MICICNKTNITKTTKIAKITKTMTAMVAMIDSVMNAVLKILLAIIFSIFSSIASVSMADGVEVDQSVLARLLTELNAMEPLIEEASRAPKASGTRLNFDYDTLRKCRTYVAQVHEDAELAYAS